VVARVTETGADGIEIYTGGYAHAFRQGDHAALLAACAETCAAARAAGLAVNVGHDLNLENLPPLVSALPGLAEASIGHELTADALILGWAESIRRYKAALAA
jgi:pyridoxine 5-phosphate synthase